MNREKFDEQMARLKNIWPNVYSSERVKIFWECYKKLPDSFIERAVTYFVLNSRKAPMHSDFERQFNICETKDSARRAQSNGNLNSILSQAKNANINADSDFVSLCAKTLRDFQNGNTSKNEFMPRCDNLDELAKQIENHKSNNPH